MWTRSPDQEAAAAEPAELLPDPEVEEEAADAFEVDVDEASVEDVDEEDEPSEEEDEAPASVLVLASRESFR